VECCDPRCPRMSPDSGSWRRCVARLFLREKLTANVDVVNITIDNVCVTTP